MNGNRAKLSEGLSPLAGVGELRRRSKAAEDCAHSTTLTRVAKLLECGRLLPLWISRLDQRQSARGLAHSKTLARVAVALLCGLPMLRAAALPEPKFRVVEVDAKIEIGYGVTVADVDGDKKPDILLADKKQIVWYRNPNWMKFVMAENLTPLDNVCIAAADIDGDGKAEVAVGAQWNPKDTVNSGAVFYLIAPADRTQKWDAVELPHEPTVHRMRWLRHAPDKYELVVVPLHGRGDKEGQGAGVKIMGYKKPADPRQPWKTELINDSLHMTHNFHPADWKPAASGEFFVASREGVFHVVHEADAWKSGPLAGNTQSGFTGAGEVRSGKLPGGGRFLATVEPMHGHQLVIYTGSEAGEPNALWNRHVIDASLKEGHALACGDLLRVGSDQIVVGWRGKNAEGKVGIKLFVPLDNAGEKWSQTLLDDNTMACEDLCLADLNGDGKPDVIASGRATRNLKVYFNETSP